MVSFFYGHYSRSSGNGYPKWLDCYQQVSSVIETMGLYMVVWQDFGKVPTYHDDDDSQNNDDHG